MLSLYSNTDLVRAVFFFSDVAAVMGGFFRTIAVEVWDGQITLQVWLHTNHSNILMQIFIDHWDCNIPVVVGNIFSWEAASKCHSLLYWRHLSFTSPPHHLCSSIVSDPQQPSSNIPSYQQNVCCHSFVCSISFVHPSLVAIDSKMSSPNWMIQELYLPFNFFDTPLHLHTDMQP